MITPRDAIQSTHLVMPSQVITHGDLDCWQSTLAQVAPLAQQCGVTRMADLTSLDRLGIPVWHVVRPSSLTLSVSLGKGLTHSQAIMSAVMEGAELWFSEHIIPDAIATWAEIGELPYSMTDLPIAAQPAALPSAMGWVKAQGLLTGDKTMLPADLIGLDMSIAARSANGVFVRHSVGLGAGTTQEEAISHALLEVWERHVVHSMRNSIAVRHCSTGSELPEMPNGSNFSSLGRVLRAISAAEVVWELEGLWADAPPFVYRARLWSDELPIPCGGYGCAMTMGQAMTGALLEAAQARAAFVSGTRDDLPLLAPWQETPITKLPGRPATVPVPAQAVAERNADPQPSAPPILLIAGLLAKTAGNEPLCCILTTAESPVTVARVVVPGLGIDVH